MILHGDAIEQLKTLPDESVQCVVTSPPYWGLRDYGTAQWGGGDEGCDHTAAKLKSRYDYSLATSPIQDGSRTGTDAPRYKDTCPKCGARRIDQQLGHEATPEEFVANLVAVMREVKRVMRKDGTLWLNLGDSYCSTAPGTTVNAAEMTGKHINKDRYQRPDTPCGLKPKDLIGIPWRVAFALQADGWWLRSDIIWHKPNPMPESCTDRPTKAHEYIFLLTKSARYYYDAEAVKEECNSANINHESYRPKYAERQRTGERFEGAGKHGDKAFQVIPEAGRNKRSVWTITTKPYPGAHFATFPPELPELCIKAGTSEHGACSNCGAPYRREVEKSGATRTDGDVDWKPGAENRSGRAGEVTTTTLGWSAACDCNAEVAPCIVLDPFFGSGTTGWVAQRLMRKWIGIELSAKYIKLAEKRFEQIDLFSAE